MLWRCIACDATHEGRPGRCACRVDESWLPAEGPAARAVRASELEERPIPRLATGDRAADAALGGGFARGFTVLIWGAGGSGKSRAALRWVSRMAPALVLSLEMPERLLVQTAREAGADLAALHVLCELDGWELEAARIGARAVLLDSVSEAYRPLVELGRLKAWADRAEGVGIAISHANARGRPLGTTKLSHRPDTLLRAAPGKRGKVRMRVVKSRFAPIGSFEVPIV